METGCNLVAGFSWISNVKPDELWFCCIDHQESHFGGWPPIEELLPLKTLTDTHRNLLVAKCSSSESPDMPVFPNDLSTAKTKDVTGLSIRARSPGDSVQSPLQRKKAKRGIFAGSLRQLLMPRRRQERLPRSYDDDSKENDKQDKAAAVKLFESTEVSAGSKNSHEEDIFIGALAAGSNPSPADHNSLHTDRGSNDSTSDSSDVQVTHVKAASPAPANCKHSDSSDGDNNGSGEETLTGLGRNANNFNKDDRFVGDISTEEASHHSTSSNDLSWRCHKQRLGSENEADGYESPGLFPERKRLLVKDTPHNPPTPDIANSTPSLFQAHDSREELPVLEALKDVTSLDSSSSEDEDEVPRPHAFRSMIVVELVRGKLGFTIGMTKDNRIAICHVKETSPNYSIVRKGDYLYAIGEFRCDGKSVQEVADEFSHTRQKTPRFVQLSRLAGVRSPPQPRFRRSQPHGRGRGQNRPSGVGRGHGRGRGRGRGRGESAPINIQVPSLTNMEDVRTIRENGKKAYDKKKESGKQQAMGKPPRTFGDLHGKGVVKKMKTVASHYYALGAMVTPAPTLPSGERTEGWKKLHGLLIWIDPFKMANPNGGSRANYASSVLEKTRIVVHGYSPEHIEDGFTVMKQIAATNFAEEGDTYKMVCVTDLKSASSSYTTSPVARTHGRDEDDSSGKDDAAPNEEEIGGNETLQETRTAVKFRFNGHTPGHRR